MRRSVLIILGLTLGLLTGLLLFSIQYFKYAKKTAVTEKIEPTPTVIEEKSTWEDQSGFSFEYPKSLSLNPHDEDKKNYAHIELTSASHSGSLTVWAKDTSAETLNDWIRQNSIKNAIDTTLGGESAKKILGGDETKEITLVTIHNGYLYQINASLADEDYWNKVMESTTNSFKFKESEAKNTESAGDQNSTDDQDLSGGDEVIE